MSEDSNEKTGGSGVETLEPRERAEAPRQPHRPLRASRRGGGLGGRGIRDGRRPRPRLADLARRCSPPASLPLRWPCAPSWRAWASPPDGSATLRRPIRCRCPASSRMRPLTETTRRRTTRPIARMPPKRLRRARTGKRVVVEGEGAAGADGSAGCDGRRGAIGHRPFRVGGRCCTGSGACSRTGPGSLGSQHRHGDGIHRQLPRRVQWLPLILGRQHGHPQPGRIRLRCPLRYRSVGGRVERLRQLHRRPCGIRLRSRQRLAVFRQRIVARIRVRFVYPKRWRKHYVDIHLRFGQRPVDVRVEESEAPCSAIRKWPRSWLHWRSSSPCSW